MKVLCHVPFNVLVHAAAMEILFVIFLCYGLAVALGHVPAWLPMISDCGVYSPEVYLFRYGFVVAAFLMATEAVMVYNANKTFSKSKLCLVLGTVAPFCLGVVGVVNEKECNDVHTVAAVIFFALYWFYMIVQTFWSAFDRTVRKSTLTIRMVLTVMEGIALITLVVLYAIGSKKYAVGQAFCEWAATLIIAAFNWVYAMDFTKYGVAEVEYSDTAMHKCPNLSGCHANLDLEKASFNPPLEFINHSPVLCKKP